MFTTRPDKGCKRVSRPGFKKENGKQNFEHTLLACFLLNQTTGTPNRVMVKAILVSVNYSAIPFP